MIQFKRDTLILTVQGMSFQSKEELFYKNVDAHTALRTP
jgi:hypothetical protein